MLITDHCYYRRWSNTNRYYNQGRTRWGLMFVRMQGYQKEPVHELPELAKCNQRKGEVGGAWKGRVIGMRTE